MEEFLDELAQSIKRGEVVLFLGAGISRNSGIPVVDPFIRYLLSKMGMNDEDIEIFCKSNIPFEGIIDILNQYFGETIEQLLKIYGEGSPNLNHKFIAKLATNHFVKRVYTTNFDELIEASLRLSNILYTVADYSKSSDKAQDDFFQIHKVHGTISSGVLISLQTIASKDWIERIRRPIEYVFKDGSHLGVLILGYSFSDKFDINPIILNAASKSEKSVYLFNHDKRLYESVSISNHLVLKGFKGRMIYGDTDKFVSDLWMQIFPLDKLEVNGVATVEWKKIVDLWISSLKSDGRENALLNCCAQLLNYTGESNKAERLFLTAIANEKNVSRKNKWKLNLAIERFSQGKLDEAEEFILSEILNYKNDQKDWRTAQNVLGAIYLAKTKKLNNSTLLDKALMAFDEAIKVTDFEDLPQDYLGIFNNIILIKMRLGRNVEAFNELDEIISKSEFSGTLRIKADALNNKGLILCRCNQAHLGESFLNESLRISIEIGYAGGEVNARKNLKDFCGKG